MKNLEMFAEILKILGHPVRLRIVYYLIGHDGCNVTQMIEKLHISQSLGSQHLQSLKNCGIVAVKNEGTKRCYRIKSKQVIDLMSIFFPATGENQSRRKK